MGDQRAQPASAVRPWVPTPAESYVQELARSTAESSVADLRRRVDALIEQNTQIHDRDCVNLNPATNTMNPRAAEVLSQGLSSRTSLGYPGQKYEMGLEAIEQIEVIAAELASEVFRARHAEVRVPSGAIANLYAFMAVAVPGDSIIVPPATIAGHVTHNREGVAGWYGLDIHEAPIDADRYTIDVPALETLAERVRPKLISVGSSLNLAFHDVAGLRQVADAVGAKLLFDAAHLSGPIAGGVWPNPLDEGAHLMTMSTYKSLGGPTAGLLVTNEEELAQRVDSIAFPGMTANFDVGKTAALAITLLDWIECGARYATAMIAAADRLARTLQSLGVAVVDVAGVPTRSHAFALDVDATGGGQATAEHLRRANLLTSAIGLPSGLDAGLRVGTNEIVRWGAAADDMETLAELMARALAAEDPATVTAVAADVTTFRRRFPTLHYLHSPQKA